MIIFRLLESTRSSFEELLVNQQERESQRHEDFLNNTFRGFLGQVAKMGSYDGLKRKCTDCANHLVKLSDQNQTMLRSQVEELCKNTEVQVGITEHDAFTTFEKYLKKVFSLQYKIELHCDWFTFFIDSEFKKFENQIEAKCINEELNWRLLL